MQDWADKFNAGIEMVAGIFVFASVGKLRRDREVKGISPVHAGFQLVYSAWFLLYMWHLEQWWSLVGGLLWSVGVVAWTSLAVWYTFRGLFIRE